MRAAVRALDHKKIQIIDRTWRARGKRRQTQVTHGQRADKISLEDEIDLKYRMSAAVSLGLHGLHHALERHFLVGDGLEHGGTHASQELDELGIPRQVRP